MLCRTFTKGRQLLLSGLFIFITLTPTSAQRVIPRFETLTVDDGLSQNSVYTIHQDKMGFMWFGTSNGLNRYDGESIKVFRAKTPLLAKANINFVRAKIIEDNEGQIWYANETGIYYYDPIKEVIEVAFDFMSYNAGAIRYLNLIQLDDQEHLWLLAPAYGLMKFSIRTRQMDVIPFPKEIPKTDFPQFANSFSNSILIYFNQMKKNLKYSIISGKYEWMSPRSGVIHSDGKSLYLLQDDRVERYQPANKNETISLKGKPSSLVEDMLGRIWIATANGLYAYFPNDKKTEEYHHETFKLKSLPFDITTCLYIDTSNNLWIGTDGGGVSRLDLKPNKFSIFPSNQGDYPILKDYFIKSLFEDDQGRIWFGTLHNGFCIYNPADGSLKNYDHQRENSNSLPTNNVSVIFRDHENAMWLGHNQGISKFDEEENRFVNFPLIPFSDNKNAETINVNTIIQLANKDILVGTSLGVIQIRKNGDQYELNHLRSINLVPTYIVQVTDGDIWIATREQGLNHITLTQNKYILRNRFFLGTHFRSIHIDSQDQETLWLCSGAGLIRFNIRTHAYTIYNEDQGMSDSYAYGILEDDEHNFWISTNSGLYNFDRKTDRFRNYTVKDGLQSNEFNAGAFYKGVSGKFYFGGINGFNYFSPTENTHELIPPKVTITNTFINDKPVRKDSLRGLSNALTLNYFENDLSFTFGVLDYTRPDANQVQFKLEGWDNKYITSSVKNARYSNLLPGNYVMRVRGSSNGRTWGEEEILTVNVLAPFWKTSTFYAAIIIVIIGSIITTTRAYYKQKVKKRLAELEKQHAVLQERERMSKDMHDDLGTGLSKISILSELAKQSKQLDDYTQRQLSKISESSRELTENLSELIWSNSPVNDSLKKLLWYIREHLSPVFDGTNTSLTITISEIQEDKEIPAAWRRNIFLVTKESLHNVLKHAGATQSSLTVSIDEGNLKIVIADNGKGFDVRAKATSGNGLRNMRKRITDCGGEFHIESKPGNGTTLSIEVPFAF